MKKYWVVFKNSWQRELEYRFNFFIGRLRNIVILLLLYFVWNALTYKTGQFAGYSREELFTYVFGVNILRSIIFGAQSRQIASEINDGWFSKYLLMPINHFWYEFFRQLAERGVHLVSSILEVSIFIFAIKAELVLHINIIFLLFFVLSIFLAIFLYFIFSYLVSLIAFWSREAMGPRFLFEWFLEFTSGVYFPLDIVGATLFTCFSFLPFMYVIYFPITIYLNKYNYGQIIFGIFYQVSWIIIIGFITHLVWKKGLKKYTGEGI